MKQFHKLSLRIRITLLTGLIVFTASLSLTLTSIYNSRSHFVSNSQLLKLVPLTESVKVELPKEEKSEQHRKSIPAVMIQASKTFDWWSYTYLFIISAFATIAVYFIIGRALKPVKDLSEAARSINGTNMQERIPERAASDEIGSLIHSFNSMLERLEQSFQRQKQFSANAAHELKTPLATINAGIQVLHLDESPDIADCLETLEIAEHNVKRLIDVVDNLFLLTNESAEQYGDLISVDEIVTDIINELTPLYHEKQVRIDRIIRIDSFRGNRILIRRAFFNLLENAMKYSNDGGTITILAQNDTISISNTGTPIPKEDLFRIFEPFYRVDQSRSRKIGGAGLGLSIVKTIAEKHGFTIAAENENDAVTKITMTLS